MKKLGILLSGRGSNFLAIAENVRRGTIPAQIAFVISNRPEAPGLDRALELGLNAICIPSKGKSRDQHDAEVIAALQKAEVDLICLAGYMRLLSPAFIRAFPQKILNIHPSLLPAFPGLDAQKQAFDYGVKVSGCTVHFVDEFLDHGAIIVQKVVPVLAGDDDHTDSQHQERKTDSHFFAGPGDSLLCSTGSDSRNRIGFLPERHAYNHWSGNFAIVPCRLSFVQAHPGRTQWFYF